MPSIATLPGIKLDPATVDTNIIIFEVEPRLGTAAELVARLHERGVWMLATAPTKVRAVTHLDVSAAQIGLAIGVCRKVCQAVTAA